MKLTKNILIVTSIALSAASTQAATIVPLIGTDFDNGSGTYDETNLDDLVADDGITVSTWDASGQSRLSKGENVDSNTNSAKLNGDDNNNSTTPLANGTLIAGGSWTAAFTISVDSSTTLNLNRITFDTQVATPSTNGRWLVFGTSIDGGEVTWNVSPNGRSFAATNAEIDLSATKYQGLTDTDITFYWAAGGPGSGDIEFDNIVIEGATAAVPEPSSAALIGLGGLSLILRRRK